MCPFTAALWFLLASQIFFASTSQPLALALATVPEPAGCDAQAAANSESATNSDVRFRLVFNVTSLRQCSRARDTEMAKISFVIAADNIPMPRRFNQRLNRQSHPKGAGVRARRKAELAPCTHYHVEIRLRCRLGLIPAVFDHLCYMDSPRALHPTFVHAIDRREP